MTVVAGRTIVLVLLLACWLPAALSGGAAASSASVAETGPTPVQPVGEPLERVAVVQESDSDDANGAEDANETVRHRNPDEYDEDGSEAALERWLSDWLSNRLEESATEISEGQYDRASDYVGEEFEERLGQYVEVAGDGGDGAGSDDGDAGDDTDDDSTSFEQVQANQRELVDALAAYNETRAEYESAREAGNRERARELARELEGLAAEIGSLSRSVQDHYGAISARTEANLTDSKAAIETTNREVQAEQERIREAEFIETELTVTADGSGSISAADPLAATGELRTTNGTPIANEEIRLAVGNQELRTETDAAGSFEVEYHPISVPVDAESVTVRYVPDRRSGYLASETTVPVAIEQVEPTLSVSAVEPSTVAYNDTVTVDASLAVGERAIDDVPLAVSIDGNALGVGSLESNTVALEGNATVPAAVPPGQQPLTVALPFEEQALARTTAETTITVAETTPDLSLSASHTGDREVTVDGTLVAAGNGLEGRTIQLRADETTLETMTTDEQGSFGGTLSVPDEIAAGDRQLTAVADGEGTNLARTDAATTVSFPAADGSGSRPAWHWLVGAAVVLAVVGVAGGVWYWYRGRDRDQDRDPDSTADETPSNGARDESPPSSPRGGAEPDAAPSVVPALLSAATEGLSRGEYDDAVRACYGAVRRTLGERLDSDERRAYTHWEFYNAYRDQATADGLAASLRDVTDGYERAAFGTDDVSEREATRILERTRQLCDVDGNVDAAAERLPTRSHDGD